MNKYTVILVLAVLLLLVGCGEKNTATKAEGVAFTDALGREVYVPERPERVAALLGSFAEIWLLAGGDVVATADDAWEDFGLELDAVNIGGAHSPNLELLFSSDPELVIASAATASNVEMCDILESAGITVVYFEVTDFYSYLEMLDICTKITGRRDLYEKNGEALKNTVQTLKKECEGLTSKEKTVLILRASSSGIKAKGSRGTVLGEMLSDLGCINIADSDTALIENLSVESIIKNEPYRIFAVTMGSDTESAEANLRHMIESDPAMSSLEAVSENRLHIMDKRLFNMKPNAKWAKAYEELVTILFEK